MADLGRQRRPSNRRDRQQPTPRLNLIPAEQYAYHIRTAFLGFVPGGISPEGEAMVEVRGHAGRACKDLTKQLESALGETTADMRTVEYYQAESRHENRRLRT